MQINYASKTHHWYWGRNVRQQTILIEVFVYYFFKSDHEKLFSLDYRVLTLNRAIQANQSESLYSV